MQIGFDPAERARTLAERGLDFADAATVFAGPVYEFPDERFAYGERRFITVGLLHGRMVVIVWTQRIGRRHIISMRKANRREQRRYQDGMG